MTHVFLLARRDKVGHYVSKPVDWSGDVVPVCLILLPFGWGVQVLRKLEG